MFIHSLLPKDEGSPLCLLIYSFQDGRTWLDYGSFKDIELKFDVVVAKIDVQLIFWAPIDYTDLCLYFANQIFEVHC